MLDLAAAMDGPFADWYGGKSWDAWRVAGKAAYAVPMSPTEVEFFKSIAGGREPPRHRVREWWCCIGRGGGKDSIASGDAAISAATFDPSILRPGERAVVACFAVDKDQARIIFRYIKSFFDRIPQLADMVERVAESDGIIELSNQVDISVMTGNFRSVRGRPILRAILDEVAFMRSEESSAPDTELYRALLPGLRLPQSMMIGISSPYRKDGLLYRRYREHYGKDSDDVLVLKAASHIMNSTLDTRDRDRQMVEDPSAARAEWFAEFRDDLVTFIDPAVVDLAVVEGRTELPPVSGVAYVGGVDPSGGSSDAMTFSVSHAEGERGILDCVGEWRPPFSPETVVREIADICRRYNIRSVVGDRYGGAWVSELFRKHGIEYVTAPMSRSDFYLTLLPALNSVGRIELLDNRRMISQLCSLERRTARSGKDSVDHPSGGHDDMINAAAIALVTAALAPKSSADHWLTYMERRCAAAGVTLPFGTEVDPVRVPGGWNFSSEALVDVVVPSIIAAEGRVGAYTIRHIGGQPVVSMTCAEAAEWLRNPVWRQFNPELAKKLLGEAA